MSLIKKILGICRTSPPSDSSSWTFSNNIIEIDLERVPELSNTNGAIRIEGKGLPLKVLVFHGKDNTFHAIMNRCSHMGRRIDPVPDTDEIQCCSVMGSTYSYSGKVLSGPADNDLLVFPISQENNKLLIQIA